MSYDFNLRNPATMDVLTIPPHLMHGGNIPCEYENGRFISAASEEAYLNFTYNYSHYYYEALPKEECIQRGWNREGGVRAIEGLSGAEAVPVLDLLIQRIRDKYCPGGKWASRTEERTQYTDRATGMEISSDDYFFKTLSIMHNGARTTEEAEREMEKRYTARTETVTVYEGDMHDYWEETAANALRPLYQLRAMSLLRPDGVWTEDS